MENLSENIICPYCNRKQQNIKFIEDVDIVDLNCEFCNELFLLKNFGNKIYTSLKLEIGFFY